MSLKKKLFNVGVALSAVTLFSGTMVPLQQPISAQETTTNEEQTLFVKTTFAGKENYLNDPLVQKRIEHWTHESHETWSLSELLQEISYQYQESNQEVFVYPSNLPLETFVEWMPEGTDVEAFYKMNGLQQGDDLESGELVIGVYEIFLQNNDVVLEVKQHNGFIRSENAGVASKLIQTGAVVQEELEEQPEESSKPEQESAESESTPPVVEEKPEDVKESSEKSSEDELEEQPEESNESSSEDTSTEESEDNSSTEESNESSSENASTEESEESSESESPEKDPESEDAPSKEEDEQPAPEESEDNSSSEESKDETEESSESEMSEAEDAPSKEENEQPAPEESEDNSSSEESKDETEESSEPEVSESEDVPSKEESDQPKPEESEDNSILEESKDETEEPSEPEIPESETPEKDSEPEPTPPTEGEKEELESEDTKEPSEPEKEEENLPLYGRHNTIMEPQEKLNPVELVRVVDGDTIIVMLDGARERVRFIGMDTPESVHPDADRNVAEGKIASDFLKEVFASSKGDLFLEYDVQPRDRYSRLLAYVWLDGLMLNETLLTEGYANVATFPPNTRYVDIFKQAEKEAREAERGLWKKPVEEAEEMVQEIEPASFTETESFEEEKSDVPQENTEMPQSEENELDVQPDNEELLHELMESSSESKELQSIE
ncbi:thermonuclease family protein [Dolosicoccus paucivorans]|uniref:thermonuclease family protein n=1 Tax=Dolosicoccus paucivorans TaxID=84521 RepID=UPI0015E0CACF|nr:thermonuclease family protein [Dolosicoccus paucivorans]